MYTLMAFFCLFAMCNGYNTTLPGNYSTQPIYWTTKSTNESNSTNVATNTTSSTACEDIGDIVCSIVRFAIFFGTVSVIFILGIGVHKLRRRGKKEHLDDALTYGYESPDPVTFDQLPDLSQRTNRSKHRQQEQTHHASSRHSQSQQEFDGDQLFKPY